MPQVWFQDRKVIEKMRSVIFITAPTKKEADSIAAALIKKKLAACVNIIDRIDSVYRWKGKVEHAKETLLMIKSKVSKIPAIIKVVKAMHSYEVPEIIALPITAGEGEYLRWIDESVG